MSKRVTWLLVGLMGLSLIGLIGVQYFWVKESYNLKEQQFSQSVLRSLKSAKEMVDNKMTLNSHDIEHPLSSLDAFLNRRKKNDRNQQDGWTQRLDQHLNNQLDLFQNFFKTFKPGRFQFKPLKKSEIDSILSLALNNEGITIPFDYAVFNHGIPQITSNKSRIKEIIKSPYRSKLYSHTLGLKKHILLIDFPKKRSFIMRQMGWMLILSTILIIVIVGCFSFAITMIFKQRQIADMKSDFINNMTHEFKTPIATISLASEALQEASLAENKDTRHRFLSVIEAENNRLKNQVEKVLNFAKINKKELDLNKETLNTHEMIQDLMSSMELIFEEKNAEVKCLLNAKNHFIKADQIHLYNTLRNLLDNSLKYTKEKPQIKVSTSNTSSGIQISIQDNGIGISSEDQSRVFDNFYRVHTGNKHDVKGFGLGLSYVKNIVQAHGGKIGLKSSLDKGSTFTIILPFNSKDT